MDNKEKKSSENFVRLKHFLMKLFVCVCSLELFLFKMIKIKIFNI